MPKTDRIMIPEEILDILYASLWSLENHDNSMSGMPTADANRARDWLEQNTDWEEA